MFTRWKKVFADFWGNKTRTLLMVLTITVGVFSVGLVNNMSRMMNHDMDSDFLSSSPAEATIYAGWLNDDWVRWLSQVKGVKAVEGRTSLSAKWPRPDGSALTLLITALKSSTKQQVGLLKPADEADSLPALGLHEVLFDRTSTGLVTLQPGDLVQVELPDGEKRSLRFAGYVHDVSSIPSAMSGMVSAYVTRETATWMGAQPGYNTLLVSTSGDIGDRTQVEQAVKGITDRFDREHLSPYSVSIDNPGHHFAWQITQGVVFILQLFGWMTVALSCFLIINTIVALMSQHTRQIGIMKAIGADFGQIFPMYLALILGFGCAALVLSAPLSAEVAALLLQFMGGFLNFNVSPAALSPEVVGMQAGVALLAPLLAAAVPLANGLRLPVREALGSYGLGGGAKAGVAPRESALSFIARPVLVSLRNAFRRKARVSLTILTLILAGAIFIGVYNLWASFAQVMVDIQGYFLADVNVAFDRAYPFEVVKRVALTVPGVASAEGWLSAEGKFLSTDGTSGGGDRVAFIAPPSTSTLIQPKVVEGRWLLPGDTNAIVVGNHLLRIHPELRVGDWVTIKINDKKSTWQIVGFYRLPGNINPPLIYTNYEQLAHETGLSGQVFELRVLTYDHDSASQETISQELQKLFKPRKIGVTTAQTAAVWLAQQKSQTDVLIYNMMIMAGLIALVGGLGLASTMSLNVMERTHEIGVMRAIGASDWDTQKIVISEGLVIGLVSWLFGVVLSVPITYVLDYGVGASIFQSPLDVVFDWNGSLIWLAGMLVLAAAASAVPAWRASRLTVRETLVYE